MKPELSAATTKHSLDALASRRRFLLGATAFAMTPLSIALAGCGGGDDAQLSTDTLGDNTGCSPWHTAVKTVVTSVVSAAGNGAVPGAGTLVGALVSALWPPCGATASNDVLSRADVITIVNKENASAKLSFVQGSVTTYRTALANADTEDHRRQAFETCFTEIESLDSYFQGSADSPGDEAALLPMFVLYGNLFLAVAVDAHVNQSKWAYSTGSPYLQGLQLFLNRAVPYVNQIYEWSYMHSMSLAGVNYHACQPFRSANGERTRLNIDALDLASHWPAFATLTTGPDTSTLVPTREVFYGPFGTGDDSGLILLPMKGASASPVTMLVDSGLRLDAVQATYPSGAGPDGVTTTPKMGDNGGGATQVNNAGTLTGGTVWCGDIINAVQFNYSTSGSYTSKLGGPGGAQLSFGPESSLLSSVFVNGVSTSYGSADTLVVGFRLDPSKYRPA